MPSFRLAQQGLQPDHNMKYKKASGKIQELIADMLQTFKDNLEDAKSKEKESKKTYNVSWKRKLCALRAC